MAHMRVHYSNYCAYQVCVTANPFEFVYKHHNWRLLCMLWLMGIPQIVYARIDNLQFCITVSVTEHDHMALQQKCSVNDLTALFCMYKVEKNILCS